MEAYKKLQQVRDELGWTDEEFVQFVMELYAYTEKILDGKKNKNKSTSCSDEEEFLRRILAEFGIPTNIKEYHYILTAILLCIEDSTYVDQITKVLYPEVAKKYNTTSCRVERAIRHAVETAWDNGNMDLQEEIFAYSVSATKGKPTNSHFLSNITEYIKVYLPEWQNETWKP